MSGEIGARIRMRRLWRNMTLGELSDAAHVSRGYLSELESGVKRDPGARVLKRIALALGVTLDWFFADEVEA